MDLGVKNSVAFVSGGGEGIGRIVATMLAQEGASVALADREPAALEETAKEVRALGAKALTFQLDVTNCFLVSNRASWITGQTLSVNGGYSMV
ncbi:MAG: SDR family oxidoreductase [Betaproteobacteria bacterium]|nr:SDR family oxidoreductase [Betaproteobacteria bacterium]